jgi:hypothetical protein
VPEGLGEVTRCFWRPQGAVVPIVNVINESIQRKQTGASVMESRGVASPRLASREAQKQGTEPKYNES